MVTQVSENSFRRVWGFRGSDELETGLKRVQNTINNSSRVNSL